MKTSLLRLVWAAVCFPALAGAAFAQSASPNGKAEWDRTLELAKKEGQVVVSIPASNELRKLVEEGFKKRYSAIELELVPSRGSTIIRRIADEYKAGVHHFDIHIGGSNSVVSGLLDQGVLEPVEPYFILPEVKDQKNWWGGHMWVDRARRYIYDFQAYLTESMWRNETLTKAEEFKNYDDLLNPKWKGKIGFLDPRTPGAGDSLWAYIWYVKGEDYLKKLAGQSLSIGRDQRLLGESLAKGKIAIVMGLTYYSLLPFVNAGLPVKPLPHLKEGTFGTGGSGNLAIIKNPPHPNATKIFVNWLLSREGQEITTRALGQATRRLDVDTKWLKEYGVLPAKDSLSVKDYLDVENQSEEKLEKVREPAIKFANKLLD
ncbi:MAG TPA: extracellular solute-binding protein [Candidatus Binatia bacterium]